MRKNWFLLLLFSLCVVFVGCEDDDDGPKEFRVSPSSTTLRSANMSVVLKAVGGHLPVTWTVSDATLGAVTGDGRMVTYTRTTALGANVVKVTDSNGSEASAAVVQESTTQETVAPLTISSGSVTVSTDSGTHVFRATGGTGSYFWRIVGNPAAGILQVS